MSSVTSKRATTYCLREVTLFDLAYAQVLFNLIQSAFIAEQVTGYLSEGSFVRNGVVQIPKFDAKPNPNSNPNPNPMPIRFRQMTLQTSELSPAEQAESYCYI